MVGGGLAIGNLLVTFERLVESDGQITGVFLILLLLLKDINLSSFVRKQGPLSSRLILSLS